MAEYFSKMPLLLYSLENDDSNITLVKNIFARTRLAREVINNAYAFFEYIVQDYDTPEMIAHKYYKDVKKHWVVLFSNYITDPYFEFPMNSNNLNNYIINKYGSIANAQSNLHHVVEFTTIQNVIGATQATRFESTEVSDFYYDSVTGTVQQRTMPTISNPIIQLGNVTITTSDGATCVYNKELIAISNYDYEVYSNEQNRTIKLLDPRYVPTLESELVNLLTK